MAKEFYSNGKLLLTGEYAVLNGALSLAVPTRYGQSLSVKDAERHELQWKSYDENGEIWFEGTFDLLSHEYPIKEQVAFHLSSDTDNGGLSSDAQHKTEASIAVADTLSHILRNVYKLNPKFLSDKNGCSVETKMTFPRDWGLGSSSTLINNIALWAEINPFHLLWESFSGSGYDIACAQHDRPILYRLKKERTHTQHQGTLLRPIAEVDEVDFNPPFQDQLYFIHLNKKQNTREGITGYQKKNFDKVQFIEHVSEITRKIVSCKSLSEFESLMTEHEVLLSKILQKPTVKESLFPDFSGIVKSLGAWGGDFVLVTGDATTPSYFKGLGYGTVLPYKEMVLKPSG